MVDRSRCHWLPVVGGALIIELLSGGARHVALLYQNAGPVVLTIL